MTDLLIKGAHVLDPATKRDGVADVLIRKGKIEKIGKSLECGGAEILDASGKQLLPGFFDLHTHFREPGFEAKETIHTGARAALMGGYVASVSMPNTQPPCDEQSVIDNIIRKAREVPYAIFPCGTISKGREGKELSEMADLKHAGIVAVSDDGDWVQNSLLMRRALEYASMLGLIVMSHCEDRCLTAGGIMHEGLTSTKLGLPGIPAASEEIAVARDIELARVTGAHLHLCHLSTARSVELVRRAKAEGIRITSEVTPHNLTVTDLLVEGYNTNCKMYPPLRTEEDVLALQKGLREGVIDCVATDHAPHTQEEKMQEFDHAPFGTIGLETAFGVVVDALFHGKGWSLAEIVRVLSVRPAEILGKEDAYGRIEEGKSANVTLVDVDATWTVTPEMLGSKSRNSCFMKKKLKGQVLATVCQGKLWNFHLQGK